MKVKVRRTITYNALNNFDVYYVMEREGGEGITANSNVYFSDIHWSKNMI